MLTPKHVLDRARVIALAALIDVSDNLELRGYLAQAHPSPRLGAGPSQALCQRHSFAQGFGAAQRAKVSISSCTSTPRLRSIVIKISFWCSRW